MLRFRNIHLLCNRTGHIAYGQADISHWMSVFFGLYTPNTFENNACEKHKSEKTRFLSITKHSFDDH